MKYKYTLMVNDQYLGEGLARQRGKDAMLFPPEHHAVYCKFCGNVWARFMCDKPDAHWFFLCMPCEQCGTGRLNLDYWIGDEADAPIDWLRREFLILMQHGKDRYWHMHHMSNHQWAKFADIPDAEPVTIDDFDPNIIPEF